MINTLLIDDEKSFLDLAKTYLEKENKELKIKTTNSPKNSLKQIKENDFDCIVCDYQMPQLNGIEVLKKVRNELELDLPFIVFTGKGREKVAMEALNLGANRYIKKGGDPTAQFGVLAKAIEQEIEHYDTKKALKEREKEYRTLVETTGDIIIVHDENGKIKFVNQAGLNFSSYSGEEVKNKNIKDFLPKEEIPELIERKKKRIKKENKDRLTFETSFINKDGEKINVDVESTPLIEKGKFKGELVIARDITERKEKEEELQREQERFRKIFNNVNDAIYLHRLTEEGMPGKFIEVNDVACEMLGYSKKEFFEMSPQNIDSSKKADEVAEAMEELLRKGEVLFEMLHQAKDGTEIPVEIHSHLFELEGEKRVLSVVRDISDWKERERELKLKDWYLDHIPEFVQIIDEKGNIIYRNQSPMKDEIIDKDKIEGSRLQEFIHPEDIEKALKKFTKALENPREEYTEEIRGKTEDGWRWFEGKIINYLDKPKIEGLIITGRDITERKKKEEEIQRLQQEYQNLFNSLNDPILIHDYEGNFIAVNDAVEDQLGYSKEKLLSMNLEEIIPPDYEEGLKKRKDELEEEKTLVFESVHVTKEGEKIPVETSTTLINFRGEKAFISVVRDITKRKKAEKELKREKNRAQRYLETAEVIMIGLNHHGEVIQANRKASEVLGYNKKDIIGKNWFENFVPKKHRKDVQDVHQKIEKDKYPKYYENPILTKSGEVRTILWHNSPLENEEGNITGTLSSGIDITERKKAEKREEFLHSLLRHDVKNKIQIIQGYLELSKDYDLPEGLEDYFSKAEKATKESVEVIEKVRTLRELSSKEETKEVDLCSLLQEVIDKHEEVFKKNNIELECIKEEIKAKGGALLEELFSNILENATKHANCDKIKISAKEKTNTTTIIIEDDGQGISDEKKDKLFKRGFKDEETGGTGLGLYLAKEIAKNYKGNIEIKDSELGGARFDITLEKP